MSFLILALIFVSCDSLSIGFGKNVKRDIDVNLNPDWLQLKNKQDNELREFVEVKSKPKKRLAMPMNFILRAVAEPEGDDYYDKGQGDSDNEDYFEKKEWSDVHRSVQAVDAYTPLNANNLSDIEGIVHIITKPVNHPLTKVPKNRGKKNKNTKDKSKRQNDAEFSYDNTSNDDSENPKKEEVPSKKNKLHRYEDDVEYEDGISEKPKSKIDTSKETEKRENEAKEADQRENEAKEAERRENEAKKAKILEGVDELKLRHAEEQRTISENAKEEEIHKEEIERDRIKPRQNVDKYGHIGYKWKKNTQDYSEEYDDQEPELKDKYKINHWKSTTTSPPPKAKSKKNKTVATGKLSVFRNPHLYMVNEEEDDISTTKTTTTKTKTTKTTASPKPTELRTPKPKIYSSRYSKSPEEDNVRISLVPEDESKEGEPTLFFPKVKDRRKQSIKTTRTPNFNFNEDETTSTSESESTVPFVSYNKTAPSSEDAASSATHTLASTAHTLAPPVSDTASTENLDLKSSPSDEKPKKEEIKNDENYDIKSGKGKKYSSEHDEVHEEHGKKAYEGLHKEVKTDKGHHDKEDYLDKYDDKGTIDKVHHDEKKHYGIHHHEEHGKKHAKYEESGKHSKGHSTKGSHDIHKKDEYEKKVEFFEEEGDSFDDEGDGGHHSEKDHSSGDHFKKSYKKAGYAGHSKGETGHFGKGDHGSYQKGHRQAAGYDSHGKHGAAHHKKGGADNGRRWIFHHGHPAKTANLVMIDKRADAFQHGPQYYG